MKRGNRCTGVPNGGCPQFGGQTYRGAGGVSSLNNTTAAMINTPTIKDYILNQDKTPMIQSQMAEGFTQYHMQTFDQSVLGLLRDGLVTEEEALKNCNNPNELNLKLKGILATNDQPLVSSDFNHNPASSIFDATITKVSDGTLVKVYSWYDNEWGFSNRMLDVAVAFAEVGVALAK